QIEYRLREAFDLVLDALDEVGHAKHDGIDQAGHDRGPRRARGVSLLDALQVEREGFRLRVAHRYQPVAGENERDRGRLRHRRLDVVDDRRGHEVRAALLIETVGGFDLAHLGTGRDIDRQRVLDELVLFRRRLQQVDPYAIAGERRPSVAHLQAFAVRFVDGHHAQGPLFLGASYARAMQGATA